MTQFWKSGIMPMFYAQRDPEKYISVSRPFIDADEEVDFFKIEQLQLTRGHTATSISYDLNNLGYRCENFDSLDPTVFKILICGCSHTFGVGNKLSDTWGEKFRAKFPNSALINLSSPGASPDYVTRSIYQAIDVIQPNLVAVQWPADTRFEVILNNKLQRFFLCKKNFHENLPLLEPDYREFLLEKNKAFVRLICRSANIPYVSLDITDEMIDSIPETPYEMKWARDNGHYGPAVNQLVADMLYAQYKEIISSLMTSLNK